MGCVPRRHLGSCSVTSVSKSVSHSDTSDSVTPWTIALQVPLSREFSRQENCSGLPFSALQVDSFPSEPLGRTAETQASLPTAASKAPVPLQRVKSHIYLRAALKGGHH